MNHGKNVGFNFSR